MTDNKTIKLSLKQEVSTIDIANGVSINGFPHSPALSTRRAETDVELQEGQSFIVAGLVDKPRDGELFEDSRNFQHSDPGCAVQIEERRKIPASELVIMVTPEITLPPRTERPQADSVYAERFPGSADSAWNQGAGNRGQRHEDEFGASR